MPLVDTGGTAFRLADAVGLVEKIVAVAQPNGRQPWKR